MFQKFLSRTALALVLVACAGPSRTRSDRVRTMYLAKLDTLSAAVVVLDSAAARVAADSASQRATQVAFAAARAAYKRVEALLEYITPVTADAMNGPAIPEIEPNDPAQVVLLPEGFQVIEEYLYPTVNVDERAELLDAVRVLAGHARRARSIAEASELTDNHVFDALRLEVTRIVSLGLSGFDSPIAGRSAIEAADAIAGIRTALQPYMRDLEKSDTDVARAVADRLTAAESYLRSNLGFNELDRATWIVAYAVPLATALDRSRVVLGVELPTMPRLWRATASTPFERGAWDAWAFAPAHDQRGADVVKLGERLFFDPVLSRDSVRSCASCHDPNKAFTDRLARSIPLGSANKRLRNAPTLINAALQTGQFYDLRTTFLEDQVADVVSSRHEMNGSLAGAARRLGMTEREVQIAIASYIRSLVSFDAPFDRFVRGDTTALNDAQRRGFNTFMGKAKCGTCHFAPLFGGPNPPTYTKTEVEVLGVPSAADTINAVIDPDVGAFAVTRVPLHRHAFKTPSLRNVAITAPYMHNGVYRTLEEVIDFYNRGGGAGIGIELPNQTLPRDRLDLTADEKADLVAFLNALTDTSRTKY